MLEFCRCGKPVKKAGRCAACYEVDQRARRKQESEAIHLEIVNTGYEDLLRSQLIPLFKRETDELITKWTEKNIVLPDGEGFFSISAPNWDFAPEMQFIFEQLKNPDVKEIYLQFGSQSSKTLFEICAISWFIADRKVNGMFVPPDERLIKRLQVRMSNIWEKSKIMNYEPKKGGKEFSSFGTNRVAWGLATSPSSLAEMPADFVVFDEIDEIKPQDVNPIQLARSRGRTKPNFKLILASTPKLLEGNGGIQDYYNNSKRYAIEMQCPHCKEWSEFTEECISAEEGADYREIEAKGLGFAICPSNGCEIRDESHEQMVVTQRWKDLDPDLPCTYVGFHKASWNTIHNDFSSIAAKRVKAKEEGTNSFKDFYNSECAKPTDLDALGGDIEQTELALEKYNRKEIPEDVKSITIGIDVGTDRVYCVVIGWAPDNKTLFSELTPNWIGFGQKEIDLPGIEEDAAYYLSEGIQGQGEYHIWSVNLLINGAWIQVGATFFNSLEDAIPVIKAAIDSLQRPKRAEAKKITGCYLAELPEDLYVFNVHYHDNNTISADFYSKNINGEPTKGLFLGTYTNGIARGFYSLPTSNGTSERELFLKGDKSGFITASAILEKVGSIEKYVRPLDITWSEEIKYIPAEECEALLRG